MLYLLGALITVVGVIGFIAGYVIGRGADLSTAGQDDKTTAESTRLVASLTYRDEAGEIRPDTGAVLMAWPQQARPGERVDIGQLGTLAEDPGDLHQAVAAVRSLGGDYQRAGDDGGVSLMLTGEGDYHLLAVSRHAPRSPDEDPGQADLATLSRCFQSAAQMLGDRKYQLRTLDVTSAERLEIDFGANRR